MTDPRALIAPAMGVAAALCLLMAWAVDARGADRPYSLVLLEKPTAAEPQDKRRSWTLATYESRAACIAVQHGIKVNAARASLQCIAKED